MVQPIQFRQDFGQCDHSFPFFIKGIEKHINFLEGSSAKFQNTQGVVTSESIVAQVQML